MYQSIWKLTALAVIVGIGILVVVQAQREITERQKEGATESDPKLAVDSGPELDTPEVDDEFPPLHEEPGEQDERLANAPAVPAAIKTAAANAPRRSRSERVRELFEAADESDSNPSGLGARTRRTAINDSPLTASRKPTGEIDASDDPSDGEGIDIIDVPDIVDVPDIIDVAEDQELLSSESVKPALRPLPTRDPARRTPSPRLDPIDEDEPSASSDASEEDTDVQVPAARPKGIPRLRPIHSELPHAASPSGSSGPTSVDEEEAADESDPLEESGMPIVNRDAPPSRPSSANESADEGPDEEDALDELLSKPEPSPSTIGRNRESPSEGTQTPRSPFPSPLDDEESEEGAVHPVVPRRAEPTPAPRRLAPVPDEADDPISPDAASRPDNRSNPSSKSPETDDSADFQSEQRPSSASPPRSDAARRPARPKAKAKLTINKIAPSSAYLGRPMVYHIVVKNVSDLPARHVVVEDALPEGAKIDGSIPQAQLDNKRLLWKLGTLEPGGERKISVRVVPQAEGTLGSVATVNFATGNADENGVPSPSLKLEVIAPEQAVVGTEVPFQFRVRNVGDVDATGVLIRDILPAGLRHAEGDDLENEIGHLPAGKSFEATLSLTAAKTGKIVNRVILTADGNVTEESHSAVDVVGPAVSVQRAGPKRLYPGKPGSYINTVSNPGQGVVRDVEVVESVPVGMEFIEATEGGRFQALKRTVTWTIDRLAPRESKRLGVTLNAVTRGAKVSVVRARDGSGGSGEAVGTTHVSGVPALTIDLGEIAPLIDVGEQFKLRVRVINRGTDVASNVRTTVLVPAGLHLVSAKGSVEYKLSQVGTPAPGRERHFKAHREVQFAPIGRIDPKGEEEFELTFKAQDAGQARVQVDVHCDQVDEPVSRGESTTIADSDQ
ncbi:MAG: hypothetical protein ACKV0T_20205 [Planctomycetales bacterium]